MASNQPILEHHVKALLDSFLIKHMPAFNTLPIDLIRLFLSEEQARTTSIKIDVQIEKHTIFIAPEPTATMEIEYCG